jgi:hypothetical protein
VEAEIFDFIGLRKLNIIDFNRWAGCTPRSEGDMCRLGFIHFHPPSFEYNNMEKDETTVKVWLTDYLKSSMLLKFIPCNSVVVNGARGSVVFNALCYKPDGCGFVKQCVVLRDSDVSKEHFASNLFFSPTQLTACSCWFLWRRVGVYKPTIRSNVSPPSSG